MDEEETTPYTDRREILSELWVSYKDEGFFKEYIKENDLGLPLAFAKENNLIGVDTVETVNLINESFENMLALLDLNDEGWVSVDHMIYASDVYRDWEQSEEEEEEPSYSEGYNEGYAAGALGEQKRIQEVAQMHMTWAKQKNKANEFMQWHNVSEVLKPINFEYDEEEYRKSLENDGF